MRDIKFIAAIDDKLGLAKQGKLPWDVPSDRKFFRDSITSGPGLMGWNTFKSNNFKPFPTCPRNLVVTHRDEKAEGVEAVHDLYAFVEEFDQDLWIIGGGNVFRQLLPIATHLYLTRISGDYKCDVFFLQFEDRFTRTETSVPQHENGIDFVYELWQPNPR